MVSGGDEPPAVLGEDREETLPEPPADQPSAPRRSDHWTAAQGGLQGAAAPRQTPREETL